MTTLTIHDSHQIVRDSIKLTEECLHCWGCSCHASKTLANPCDRSLEEETYSRETFFSVVRQSEFYGKQMRQLEAVELEEDRQRVAKAWTVFRTQLKGSSLMMHARVSYYSAYYREG
jgi:hypothetical protein